MKKDIKMLNEGFLLDGVVGIMSSEAYEQIQKILESEMTRIIEERKKPDDLADQLEH